MRKILKKIINFGKKTWTWLLGLGEALWRAFWWVCMIPMVPFLVIFTVLNGIIPGKGKFWDFTLFAFNAAMMKLFYWATTSEPPRLRWIMALAFIFGIIFKIL